MKKVFKKLSKRIIFVLSALLVAGASAAWMDDSWAIKQGVYK